MRTSPLYLLFLLLLTGCSEPTKPSRDQERKTAPLMTRWAEDAEKGDPWNHYPRPGLRRDQWINLNGWWQYAITDAGADRPDSLQGWIRVPFPIESALSGVMQRVDQNDQIWYSRRVQVPSLKKGERLMLHFEASDWHTRVWINQHQVGEHRGGYSPFSFDITPEVSNRKEFTLVAAVWDPTTEGSQAVGKQNSEPHGIWYTPSSGIWQTVWMETVPKKYIIDYQAIPDPDRRQVWLSCQVSGADPGDRIRYQVRLKGERVASCTSGTEETVSLSIPDMQLWSPDHPVLYDLDITLIGGADPTDQVNGYFGMRKISLGKTPDGFTRIMLNNEFVFQNGTLDQGFWPDGLYTPPTEEAMVYDLEMLKKMGFNMLRKHVKVENRRYYYWTDRLGLLVWQDMPNACFGCESSRIQTGKGHTLQFEQELQDMILTLDNHPSIIMWVPFNEGWGQYDTRRIVEMIGQLDSTRLINNASGWSDTGTGHVRDIHHYPDPRAPEPEEDRAIVLGEFGGLGLPVAQHTWQSEQNWGYENMEGSLSLLGRYEGLYRQVHELVDKQGLSAVVYTQTTDVEIETNGLLTYDREVDKMGYDLVRKAHLGYFPPETGSDIRSFVHPIDVSLLSSRQGAIIYFTTDGSEPDRNKNLYIKPIRIDQSQVIRAVSVWKNGERSRITDYPFEQKEVSPSVRVQASPGITYRLYRGAWEQLPDFTQLTPEKAGISKQVNLDPVKTLTQDFGLAFSGHLKVPETQVYRLYVSSDDGGRLFINGDMVVDYDGIHGMGEKAVDLALEKGLHSVEFYYFQHLGGQGLQLSWATRDLPKTVIPAHAWYH